MLTAILEVLDITIVSVSIPHMLGSFGATSDQITWVLTSYLVAAAVGMPLTGYLSERFGRRRLLNISILGFVISSALCGLSWNLLGMVLFRLAQGLSGAPLIALSQAILLDAFPREKHGQALAISALALWSPLYSVLFWVRQSQIHWGNLTSHFSPFNPVVPSYLSALSALGLDIRSPSTVGVMAREIGCQAQMLGFNDLFWFLGWFAFAMLPLILLMKRPEKTGLVIA